MSGQDSKKNETIAIVLAAGEGSRMISDIPKPLHKIAGKSMIGHVLTSLSKADIDRIAVVIGPQKPNQKYSMEDEVHLWVESPVFFTQSRQLGTANAVLAAKEILEENPEADIIIANSDGPLITPETLKRLKSALDSDFAIAVLGFETENPTGYGRLITDDDVVVDIREEKDANQAEKSISLCNAGFWAFKRGSALRIIQKITNHNIKGEYYLTDSVSIAQKMGLKTTVVKADETEVSAVNDREQLAHVEALIQQRLRKKFLSQGVTLIAPESVYFSYDTIIGKDVTIEPDVFLGPNVVIGDHVTIHAFCHLSDTHLLEYSSVGPFARLRGKAIIEKEAKVGNFVEVKNSILGQGVKASHLSYIGDASVGDFSNIGAGTITCNYDGWKKFRTTIGKNAFIGSNTSLVAPVKIGEGAYIGSGSTITKDVAEDALAIARGRQVTQEGWAAALRKKRAGQKK